MRPTLRRSSAFVALALVAALAAFIAFVRTDAPRGPIAFATTAESSSSIEAPAHAAPTQAALRRAKLSPAQTTPDDDSIPLPHWIDATVLRSARTDSLPDGTYLRVTLLQPSDLPYRIRVEDLINRAPDGAESLLHRTELVADHILVHLSPDADLDTLHTLLGDHGATLGRPIGRRGLHRVQLADPADLDALPALLDALAGAAALRYAEPDYIVRSSATPNDPRYLDGSLWGLHNTGQNSGTPDADIDAPEGWAIRNSAPNVVVGVIDTGIRLTHEDLVANLWVNPGETANGADSDGNGFIDDLHGINAIAMNGNPDDDQGHGTHCAGTIGARGNNGVGVTGVAWNVRLMGLKFLSASGGGAVSDAITCIDYGVEHGAHILSNSWGGGGFSQALLDSIRYARDQGVIFVVAAGNSASNNDTTPVYPASLPVENIIAVASTTRTDALSEFSCFGQGSVDLGAPGSNILSTGFESNTSYVTMSGTSMATPHVAGALALLRAQFPSDSWSQLVHRLYRGVDKIPSLANGRVGTGGRLNLHGALSTTTARPFNDDFADARVIHGDFAVLRVLLRDATSQPGEPAIHGQAASNTVWFRFTPQASGLTSVERLLGETIVNMNGLTSTITYNTIPTVLGVFTGSELGSLNAIASGTDSATFTATAGVTYHIAVAGQAGAQGLLMLGITGAPANSTLANATTLSTNVGITGTNRNALSEPGEPAHAGQPAQASVWYRWTANLTGPVAFSTKGSSFDTVAAVYSGPATNPSFANLVPVASNDNAVPLSPSVPATFSRVEFQAIAGTTYYVAVDGKNGASGSLSILLGTPPPNDDFNNAFILSGTDVTRQINTFFGSREVGEPVHFGTNGQGETVWSVWTAPQTGRTTVDLSGSFFRGIIAVYTGNAVNALTLVARDGAGNRFAQVTFDAVQGTTYRIAVDAWDFPLSNVPLRLQMVPTPPNDNFAAATVLQGTRITATGSNVGGTRETGEPGNTGPSVWYRWTAPASGPYALYGERLNKAQDRWIIVLQVYTGSAVNALTSVTVDQMNGIGRDAFARFNAVAGTTYHFQVTGLTANGITGGVGPFRLDLRPRAEFAPPNDRFADAIVLDGSPVFNFRTQNYGASAEPGEPHHSDYAPFQTLWWRFAPGPGQGGDYAVATSLSEGSVGTTVYRADNPAAPSLGALTRIASNVQFANQNFPDLKFTAQEGEVYYIVTDNYGSGLGRLIFNFHRVPSNIVFSGATVLPPGGASLVTYNYGAVRETGEPSHNFTPATAGNRSLWFRWTAPASGLYAVDTIGSRLPVYEDANISAQFGNPNILGLDTVLAVYTGSTLGSLNAIATNSRIATYSGSNWSFQRNSRIEFQASAGTTYHFMVNAHALGTNDTERNQNTHQGEVHFRLQPLNPPANDAFANATIIQGDDYRTIVSTFGATKETGEPNHGGLTNGRTLWWRWTAPESGAFIVSTAGNMYDDYNARRTGLGVYTGTAVDALTTIASNQGGAGPNTGDLTWSAIRFNAVAGTTYHFGVDAAFPGNLSFILTRPAPNDNFANATVMQGSRWTAHGHNLMTTVEPGEGKIDAYFNPPAVTDASVRSVWWRWTAPVSGPVTVDTLGSQIWSVLGIYTGASLGGLSPVVTTPDPGDWVNGEGPNRARNGTRRVEFNAVAGTTYHITVQGAGFNVASNGPITLSLVGPPAVPFAPADFVALRTDATTIALGWTDVAVDEEFYELQRSPDGSSWSPLAQLAPDSVAHIDFSAPEGDDHYYRIRSVNTVGASAWVVAAITTPKPPAAPAGLAVTALSASDLRLTWTTAANTDSLRLERSATGPGGPWLALASALPAGASSYTDTGLAAATTYHYRLRGVNEIGTGPWATASGATQAAGTYTITMPASIAETAGSFTASVSRSGTSGSQILFLSSNDARLGVPASVTIPNGQSSANFTVTVNNDAIINPTDTATITAFAPAALIGESFSGPLNSELAGQSTGWGWGDAWIGVNASPVLAEPSLSFTKNGTIGTPGTRAARLTNAGNGGQAYRAFSQKYTSGSVWVSSLLYRNSTNWGTQLIIRDNPGSGAWGRVIYQNNTNHWVLEASGATATVPNLNPVQPLLGSNPWPTTFFVVMEFDYPNRKIRAWLNPDVSGSSPANALASAEVDMQSTMTGVNRLDIAGHSNADQFDEIRVATSFANLHGGTTSTRAIRILDDEAPPALSVRDQWWADYFGTTDPVGPAAFTADPDGDGIPNLLEYALGGDPLVPGSISLPAPALVEGHLTLAFTRARADLVYEVLASSTLAGDSWQVIATNPGSVGQIVIVVDPPPTSTNPRRFLRLRVNVP